MQTKEKETHYECKPFDYGNNNYLVGSFFITFVLPLVLITYSYGAIGRRLLKTQRNWSSFPQISMSVSANAMSSSTGANGGHIQAGNEQSGSLSSDNAGGNPLAGLFKRCDSSHKAKDGTINNTKEQQQRNHKRHRTPKLSLTSNQSIDSSIAIPVQHNTIKSATVKIYCNDNHAKQAAETGSIASNTTKFGSRFHRRNTEILHKMRVCFIVPLPLLYFFYILFYFIRLFVFLMTI